jgi:hypothetical protein
MSGVFAGLIASVRAAAVVPTNLVLNPSATTTSTTNWTAGERFTSIFKTTPASWLSTYYDSSETNAVEYFNASWLTVGTAYSLSFWARNDIAGNNVLVRFYSGTNSEVISITPSASTFQYFKIENILCTGTPSGGFFIDSPGFFFIDDVAIVAGATAI